MKTSEEFITPKIASTWYPALNEKNRPLSLERVRIMADDMRHGRWKLNGETIKFSNEGKLIDGQHRLAAVIESGVSIHCLICRDVHISTFETIDTGKKRSAGDVIGMLGEDYHTQTASTLGVIEDILTQSYQFHGRITNSRIKEMFEQFPEVRNSVKRVHDKQKLVFPSLLMGLDYLFRQVNPEAAEKFLNDFLSGAGLAFDDPVHVLRERLMRNKMASAKMPKKPMAALIIKAFNSRLKGTLVDRLTFGAEEKFPKILGLKYTAAD